MMTKEMCFYITKEFQENPPQPIDKDIVIKKSSERVVFVKKFGGYAMRDSVWMDNAAAFREEIEDRWVGEDGFPVRFLNDNSSPS